MRRRTWRVKDDLLPEQHGVAGQCHGRIGRGPDAPVVSRPRLGLERAGAGGGSGCETRLRSAAPALVEPEVRLGLGLGGVEGGGLVELEGVLGVAEKGEDAHVAAAAKEFAVVEVYGGGPRGKHLPVRCSASASGAREKGELKCWFALSLESFDLEALVDLTHG